MLTNKELTIVLSSYEDRIQRHPYTKADFGYHNLKQSLHVLWAKVYDSQQAGEERTSSIKRINECLASLERTVATNEEKKYKNYYSRPTRLGNKLEKSSSTVKSL